MPTEPGTLEQLSLTLSRALEPLTDELRPENALNFLGELGLHLPPSAFSPALRTAVGATATSAEQLPDLVASLVASIEADADGLQITANAAPLAAQVVLLVDSLATIADEIQALGPVPGLAPADLNAFASALPERLLNALVVRHLDAKVPAVAAVMALLGLLERRRINAGSTDPFLPETTIRTLRLDRLGDLFSDPEQLVEDLYGWGTATLDGVALLERLGELFRAVGLPVGRSTLPGPPPRPVLEMPMSRIAPTPAGVNPPGIEAVVTAEVGEGIVAEIPIMDGFELDLEASGSLAASVGVQVQPPANLTLIPPTGSLQGELFAGLARVPMPEFSAIVMLGAPGGSRLEAQRVVAGFTSSFAWQAPAGPATGDFGVEGRVEGGKLVISLAGADGFIGTLAGGLGFEAEFDLGFGWTAGGGFYFTGSGGLEIQVPTHIAFGPVELTAVTVQIGFEGGSFPIALSVDVKGALGPIAAVVERIGAELTVSFPDDQSGNVGPVDLAIGFKPPNGVGLSLDVGVVKGGGYLFIDTDRGEYAGALELLIAEFLEVKAIGLITTKNPDGTPGFSLLLIITAEFGTGIQLGFGFVLVGVGGLLGLNRTMNLQKLMEGVRTGAVESVMFPEDVIANAPRIISDLRALFPTQQGKFLIGPMVKLGWGTPPLITASVGIIIEIPGNIALVGVVKIALPTDDAAILVLQVNFAGALEFDRSRLYFFASLFESRILFMTIEGELGLLVAWGDDPNFVLTVGGFHPSFDPPALPFPSPKRVAISILNESYGRIRVSGYFAVTSNTAQFGAAAELYFGFSAISVEGHIGFDALFRFSPFAFIVEIGASVSLKAFGVGVFSIRLRFALEGPTPWRARGSGSVSLLFFEISADFDVTWGEERDTSLPPVDVMPLVAAEIAKPEAWVAKLPASTNLLVSLRALEPTEELVMHPLGSLAVTQRAIPLDFELQKVGTQRPRDAKRFSLSVSAGGLAERRDLDERFALAQFKDMSDAEKLSAPAFQPMHGGFELSASGDETTSSRMVRRSVRYEEIVIDNRFRRRPFPFQLIPGALFDHFLGGNSMALSALSQANQKLKQPFEDHIQVVGDGFAIASTVDNSEANGGEVFASEAVAVAALQGRLAADPSLTSSLHVVHAAELSGVGS